MAKYGNIIMVNFNGEDHQIKGWHPAVVVSNDIGNKNSTNISVIPISSRKKTYMPTHVFLSSKETGLPKDCWAQCEGITSVTLNNLGKLMGNLSKDILKQISIAYAIACPVIKELTLEELDALRKRLVSKFEYAVA